MGRPPTPSTILKLRGTDRPDRVNREEPLPAIAPTPDPPPGLRGRARRLWEAHAPELHRLGLLTVLDVESLATWCRTLAAQHRIEQRLRSLDALERRHQALHRRLVAANTTAAAPDLDAAYRAMLASLEQQRQWTSERTRLTRELRAHFEMAGRLGARFGFTPSDRRSLSARPLKTGERPGSDDPHDELARRRAARSKPARA